MSLNKSTHILNTSSNLLGFCLVVLTSLKVTRYSEVSMIDECTGIAAVLLIISSCLSFLSIRTEKENLSYHYERVADIIFVIALFLIFGITFLIAFTVIF